MNDPSSLTRTVRLRSANDNDPVTDQSDRVVVVTTKSGAPAALSWEQRLFAPTVYFLRNHGRLPDPDRAATLGLLTGKKVKACDGRLYPRPSKHERASLRRAALDKKEYHRIELETARLRQALWCLDQIAPGSDLAVHIKGDTDLGLRLDRTVHWLKRFAEELHNRDKACSQ